MNENTDKSYIILFRATTRDYYFTTYGGSARNLSEAQVFTSFDEASAKVDQLVGKYEHPEQELPILICEVNTRKIAVSLIQEKKEVIT